MVKRSPHRWLTAWVLASAAAGCTALVGVDQDYQLDPRSGQGGSALTGGAAPGTGGVATGGSGGTAGSSTAGTGGVAGRDGGADAGGTGGTGAGAGAGGSAGSGATGGAAGVGGVGGATGKGGTGGASGSGGMGGASGTGGSGGNGGNAGNAGGGAGGSTTGGASGNAGASTGGRSGAAGTAGAAGSSGGAGAAGTGGASGSAGAGGFTIDAGDASTGGSAGAPDASLDADAAQDAGSPCGPGTKFCGVCVATSDPTYGCAGPTCTTCEPNGTATCVSGSCVVTGCNSGYHQVGNACVPNGPEICNNNIDDDADSRTDCFDTDCLADPVCVGRCLDGAPIACDTIVTGQSTSASGSTSRISSYTCSAGTYAGSEFAYRFSGASGQRVYAEIYGLSGNLGLFQIGTPTGQQCTSAGCGVYGDAANNANAEALGFDTVAGQDYYLVVDSPNQPRNFSLSVQCSTVDGCRPVKPIEAGQNISATNNPVSGASNVTASKVPLYDCAGVGESGPEAAWIFTPTVTASYRAAVTGLSADCDLYVLSGADCGGNCLGPTTFSDQFGQASEFVTFQGVANTTYYIVVDGYLGAVCNFTIGLTQL